MVQIMYTLRKKQNCLSFGTYFAYVELAVSCYGKMSVKVAGIRWATHGKARNQRHI